MRKHLLLYCCEAFLHKHNGHSDAFIVTPYHTNKYEVIPYMYLLLLIIINFDRLAGDYSCDQTVTGGHL